MGEAAALIAVLAQKMLIVLLSMLLRVHASSLRGPLTLALHLDVPVGLTFLPLLCALVLFLLSLWWRHLCEGARAREKRVCGVRLDVAL